MSNFATMHRGAGSGNATGRAAFDRRYARGKRHAEAMLTFGTRAHAIAELLRLTLAGSRAGYAEGYASVLGTDPTGLEYGRDDKGRETVYDPRTAGQRERARAHHREVTDWPPAPDDWGSRDPRWGKRDEPIRG